MISDLFKAVTKKLIILYIVLCIPLGSFTLYSQQKFTVVLDPGHGGTDPGNLGVKEHDYLEKDIVLKIALEVGKLLEKDKNIKVVYTRKDDTFVELIERGKIANDAEADLFVSIHCDAFSSPYAYGAGTFVLGLHANERNFEIAKKENQVILLEDNYKENYGGFDPNSPEAVISITLMQEEYLDESLKLAALIQNNFVKDLKRKDRLVKQAGFIVLHQTFMPSVLVEAGFLTNKKEGAYLNSKKGQQEIAKAIYDGVKAYKKQHDDNTVVDAKPTSRKKPKKETPETRIVKGVDFRVQIASGTKKLKTAPYNFKGLRGVERIKIGAHHKYYYGTTSDYYGAKKLQTEARKKGFTSAFVVAFKNGVKVSVNEVLKTK